MVSWILKKILGSKNQRELRRLSPIVRRINELDEQFKGLSDDELRAKTAAWKEEISKIPELQDQWKKLDEILPEAFAVVKNAARRLKERQHSLSQCAISRWCGTWCTSMFNCSGGSFCTEAALQKWRPAKAKLWSPLYRFT